MFKKANNMLIAKKRNTKVLPLSTDESFSKPLYRNSNLLRVVLHRPIENSIKLNKWYRIDLKLVTEMGLLMDQHPYLIKLTCKVLVKNKFSLDTHQIECRPISEDAWDPDAARSEGFHPRKPIGGIEYRINSNAAIQHDPFYISLTRTSAMNVTNILSLTVGPIYIQDNNIEQNWSPTKNNLEGQQYRTLQSSLSNSTYFLLKEQWDFGTPGKIWDSAIVMTNILLKIFAMNSNHLSNKRVLDLSAGTGYIGLSIAQCHQDSIDPPHIILTDLKEALDLIEQNRELNNIQKSPHLSIKALSWGNKEEAQNITRDGLLDIIIASDVLYNVVHFPSLISTFRHLCGQSTIIYLCYKQRGLTLGEEKSFFNQCKKYFRITQLENIEQQQLKQFENATAVKIYKVQLHSQQLWSQLLQKSKK